MDAFGRWTAVYRIDTDSTAPESASADGQRWSDDDELLVWTVSRLDGGRRLGNERDCHVVYAVTPDRFVVQTRKFRASAQQCIEMLLSGRRAGTTQRKIELDSIVALDSDPRSGRLSIKTLNGNHRIDPVNAEEADVLREVAIHLEIRMPAGGATFGMDDPFAYSGPERRDGHATELADDWRAVIATTNARAEDEPDEIGVPTYLIDDPVAPVPADPRPESIADDDVDAPAAQDPSEGAASVVVAARGAVERHDDRSERPSDAPEHQAAPLDDSAREEAPSTVTVDADIDTEPGVAERDAQSDPSPADGAAAGGPSEVRVNEEETDEWTGEAAHPADPHEPLEAHAPAGDALADITIAGGVPITFEPAPTPHFDPRADAHERPGFDQSAAAAHHAAALARQESFKQSLSEFGDLRPHEAHHGPDGTFDDEVHQPGRGDHGPANETGPDASGALDPSRRGDDAAVEPTTVQHRRFVRLDEPAPSRERQQGFDHHVGRIDPTTPFQKSLNSNRTIDHLLAGHEEAEYARIAAVEQTHHSGSLDAEPTDTTAATSSADAEAASHGSPDHGSPDHGSPDHDASAPATDIRRPFGAPPEAPRTPPRRSLFGRRSNLSAQDEEFVPRWARREPDHDGTAGADPATAPDTDEDGFGGLVGFNPDFDINEYR